MASTDQDISLSASETLAHARRVDAQRKTRARWILLSPALILIGLFGLMPLSITLVYSFLKPGSFGGVEWVFSLDAYIQFIAQRDIFDDTLSVNWSYLSIFSRSIGLSLGATIGALILGFPTAYFIASKPADQRNFWLFLITLPFWTNLLIRTYAMLLIIRDQGVINTGLMSLGITEAPIEILYTDTAVFIGLIYSYLPFMVLPLYASLEKLDLRLIEAAYDLYASRFRVLTNVILPLAKPGIVAGCILVFIPGLGAYITPELLGGGKKLMIGNLIAIQFGSSRNWPFGSAAALILMAVVMVALLLYVRHSAKEGHSHG
ncbi:ABC transporter permease [Pseudohalocynthiibacter aestuariivivens]|jgi:spermidine/putrescine transport system permease protein|uniref:ABC transporter permease n=1 Tax=Pseudohalocynthiibacter aestuariivivens TaxID=1591409 RepID=A0ABV5JEB4_9RHOB|nr:MULTISPECIES: ABC transporter permease [Pseudohalocynthiibacter]MBS9719033.1 ABC transporter permease [Pseudohalocynthiibacter aestuariivivens]MCK0104107.1 ABC transporter permease [Pseudohalocynthiibacter sp. F2068]